MNETKKIGNAKLLVIAVVLTLVVVLGTTYAWLSISQESKIINKITAGNLELTLDDTTSEGIKLTKEIPRSYQQGMATKEYTFTLTNKSSTSSYTLSLKDLTTYTNDEDQEVTIADEDRLADSKVRYILLKDGEKSTASKSKILTDRVLDSGTIEKGKTIKYSLRIWIDSKAGDNNTEEEVMGKIFNAQISIEATQLKPMLCKKASVLHEEICNNSTCTSDGYNLNDTITYGNLGTTGVLTTGDAFDCDVNGDGVYDSETERFYYVSDMTNGVTQDSNTAVLVYYNNVSGGVASNSTTYAYDSSGKNNNGPVTAIKQLPTISQWKNVSLINKTRAITNENGGNTTTAGDLPTTFSYEGYAARLLTAQEVNLGCEITVGSTSAGEISKKCQFLMENTKYSSDSILTGGLWLETPRANHSSAVWYSNQNGRFFISYNSNDHSIVGVRPAIEVLKTNISY